MQVRLDKFLADAGIGTRSEVKNIIKKKAVTVNGVIAAKPEMKVYTEADEVAVNGKSVANRGKVTYMLHKPAGYVCALTDDRFPTVMELVPKEKDLFPVGRLDKDTEGLLLITNDGEMSHRMLSPRSHVYKMYMAVLEEPAENEYVNQFLDGVDIGDDKPTLPAKLVICDDKSPELEYLPEEYMACAEQARVVLLTIHEGRYHQVKRMFHAVGNEVIYLKRLTFGKVTLPLSLEKGEVVICDPILT